MKTSYTKQAARPAKPTHTRAKAPIISLDQPGRLRVANVLALLGISHSSLYEGMRTRGRYPKPDGYDGKIPYWNTETIRAFLVGDTSTEN